MPKKTASQVCSGRSRVQHFCHACDIKRLLETNTDYDRVLSELASGLCNRGPFQPGERIYYANTSASSIYAVSSGAVKTEMPNDGGHLQVTGFYLRGDLFGEEALGESRYLHDAIALEKTWICEIPKATLIEQIQENQSMLLDLFQLLGRRTRTTGLHRINRQGQSNAERVMGFLKDFAEQSSQRFKQDNGQTQLPMNKEDIASYLAITPESLSRILKRLENAGAIRNYTHAFALIDDNGASETQCCCNG